MRRVLLLVVSFALLAAQVAAAATVSYSDATITETLAGGEHSELQLFHESASGSDYLFWDPTARPAPGAGCRLHAMNYVACKTANDRVRLVLRLGDERDVIVAFPSATPYQSSLVLGAGGDDQLWIGSGDDEIQGGGGDDDLRGYVGDDRLLGGDGNDALIGGPGADFLDGGSGTDRALYDPAENMAFDAPRSKRPGPRQHVSLDGRANDGAPGEGDNVTNVETIVTGSADDVLVGDDANNSLSSGPGTDRIAAGAGDDEIDPGGEMVSIDDNQQVYRALDGADFVDAGAGDDIVHGPGWDSSGKPLALVDHIVCGPGLDTVVTPLPVEKLPADCERACDSAFQRVVSGCRTRPTVAAAADAPARLAGPRTVRPTANGSLRLQIACPPGRATSCRGVLRVGARSSPAKARARYAVPVGRSRSVRVRLARRPRSGTMLRAELVERKRVVARRTLVVR